MFSELVCLASVELFALLVELLVAVALLVDDGLMIFVSDCLHLSLKFSLNFHLFVVLELDGNCVLGQDFELAAEARLLVCFDDMTVVSDDHVFSHDLMDHLLL